MNEYMFKPYMYSFEVEYQANENPLNNSEKIAYAGQRLMCPIKINKIPYHTSLLKCHYVFRFLYKK